ncbi:MAG: FAD-dependent oxidoreductase [Marinagarivorans sp.]
METAYDVVVIGAGMAGLTAATHLKNAGKQVCVLEKSRGVGGRMSSRRDEALHWDHGAQYCTAQSAEFIQQLADWESLGLIAPWPAKIAAWNGSALTPTEPMQRWVGVPSMHAPLKHWAEDLPIYLNSQVLSLSQSQNGWHIYCAKQTFAAKQLVLCLPAPQAAALLPEHTAAHTLAKRVTMQPCWALLLATQASVPLPFAGIFINSGPLAWIAVNSSKPQRNSVEYTWVVHATAQWTEQHLALDQAEVAAVLMAELNRLLALWLPNNSLPHWHRVMAHRWRYARGAIDVDEPVWPQERLALAGDWLSGGKVEGAFLSGLRCAQLLLQAGV